MSEKPELPILTFGSSSIISRLRRLPQIYWAAWKPARGYCKESTCLNKAAIFRMAQLLQNSKVTSMRLLQLALIRLIFREPQENVLIFFVIILIWFLTHPNWFLKCAWAAWDNWKLLVSPLYPLQIHRQIYNRAFYIKILNRCTETKSNKGEVQAGAELLITN